MEDYIFIIIAIVLSILGAVNQSKKKKMQQMEDDEGGERQPSVFDQFFDDPVFDEPKPQAASQEPQAPKMEHQEMKPPEELKAPKIERPAISRMERPKMERTPLTRMERPSLRPRKQEEPLKKKMTTILKEEADGETIGKSYESILDGFSLKKAVIYAEIINRKY